MACGGTERRQCGWNEVLRTCQGTTGRVTGADFTGLAGHRQQPGRERGFLPELREDQWRVLTWLESMPPLSQLCTPSKEMGRLSGFCPGLVP